MSGTSTLVSVIDKRDESRPGAKRTVLDALRASDLNNDLRARIIRRKVLVAVRDQWPRLGQDTRAKLVTDQNMLNLYVVDGQDIGDVLTQEIRDHDELISDETEMTNRKVVAAVETDTIVDFVKTMAGEMNQTYDENDLSNFSRIGEIVGVLEDDARARIQRADRDIRDARALRDHRAVTDALEVMLVPSAFRRAISNVGRLLTGKPRISVPIVSESHRREVSQEVEGRRLHEMVDHVDTDLVRKHVEQAEADLAVWQGVTKEMRCIADRGAEVAAVMTRVVTGDPLALSAFARSADTMSR